MSTSNNMNSKLDFYKKITTKFTLEQYLLDIKNGDIRRSVTSFRISAHKFLDKIKSTNENIRELDPQSLTIYAAVMNDQNILDVTARFMHEVMILYEMVAVKYV